MRRLYQPVYLQTDPASCFMALDNGPVLHDHRIVVEIGRVKNRNKTPVFERAGSPRT